MQDPSSLDETSRWLKVFYHTADFANCIQTYAPINLHQVRTHAASSGTNHIYRKPQTAQDTEGADTLKSFQKLLENYSSYATASGKYYKSLAPTQPKFIILLTPNDVNPFTFTLRSQSGSCFYQASLGATNGA